MSVMARHPEAFVAADWPDLAPDRHPETLAWIARIEAARRGTELPTTRRCNGPCGRELPIEQHFFRNRSKRGGGRSYTCRDCDGARGRADRRRRKVEAFRAILGVAS